MLGGRNNHRLALVETRSADAIGERLDQPAALVGGQVAEHLHEQVVGEALEDELLAGRETRSRQA
ncbi:hypothetical protein SAMN02745121_05870 [Nannocystis exedens]|uniref:Uncharacterized protein n=1 Tax=Nannocystis exedens TaxID=54 RepID=A0A1I2E244_9BACT|nr:hypothetical protein NAEX_02247 [Nannocystis exedens]SFE86767.1 hypothetical protein SAMN02745121_05870 [Nannocystis exedens]